MSTVAYQCPSCGGELKFNPSGNNFACEYCLSDYKEAEIGNQAAPPMEEETLQYDGETVSIYNCPNCGAEVIIDDATTAATECYYCHSPVVLAGQLGGKYLPKKVIPFVLDRAAAIAQFKAWCKTKKFLPKDFVSEKSITHMSGVYFPFWIIDADTKVSYVAQGERCTTWETPTHIHTIHKVYHCHRSGDVHLEDVIKAGLKSANKRLMENVQPFDEAGMKPFTMSYLSGFQAQRRDIPQEEIAPEAHQDIAHYSREVIAETVTGFSDTTDVSFDCQEKKVDWEYGLLPVWILTYAYRNEMYYFAMNGQTGKTSGKIPVDRTKLFWVSLFFGILGIIGGTILGGLVL